MEGLGLVKRLLLTLLCAIIVVGTYSVIDIRLFNLNVLRQVREHLFKFYERPLNDESIILLNTGVLTKNQIQERVDSLIKCYPRKIGINLCHSDEDNSQFKKYFENKSWIVLAECNDGEAGSLSRVVSSDNSVTHFRTDRRDYFEFKIEHFEPRGTDEEPLYFIDAKRSFHEYELSNVAFVKEYFQGKTVLIGYLGDYLTDSIYYMRQCRVTPMNEGYGSNNILPDMYDTEISALTIAAIQSDSRLQESSYFLRIIIIIGFSFLSVIMVSLLRTRWIAINILIAFTTFILLELLAGILIVFEFDKGIYLALDELTLALAIVIIFSTTLNIFDSKKKHGTPA